MIQRNARRTWGLPSGCCRESLRGLLLLACCGITLMTGCGERRSEQHRLEGDAYLKLQKVNEAADAYHKAEVANPNNALAKVGLGRCYLVQQRYEEALEQFKNAYELDPSLDPAYADAVTTLLKMSRINDAIEVAQRYAAASPELGGVLHGFILTRAGRAAEATTLLTGLRDKFPDSVDIRINLATALLALEQPDKAEQELKAVLDTIDPKSIAARMVLSDVYRAQGKTEASTAELRKLLEENPSDPGIKLAFARSLAYGSKTDEAQNLAQEVLQQDPGSAWANYVLGSCLVDKRKYAEALPYLQAAEQALPGQPEVSHRLAVARASAQGKAPVVQEAPAPTPASAAAPVEPAPNEDWRVLWQRACLLTLLRQREALLAKDDRDLRETMVVAALVTRSFPLVKQIAQGLPESSPIRAAVDVMEKGNAQEILKQFEGWQEKEESGQILRENAFGVALARIGSRARALQLLAKCYQTWPDNAVSLYNMAHMFQEAGMSEFAAKTLQRVIARYPQNIDAYVLLPAILREGNMLPEARSAAEAAYNLFPTSKEVALNLCQAYIDTKGLDMAKRVLGRAIETHPDDAVLKVQQAVLQLQSGQPEEAIKTLEPLSVPANLSVRAELVRAFSSALLGQWDTVSPRVSAADANTVSLPLRLLLAAAQVKTNRNEDAAKTLSAGETSRSAFEERARDIALQALGGSRAALAKSDQDLADALKKDAPALGEYLLGSACQEAQLNDAALNVFRKLQEKLGYHPQLVRSIFSTLTRAQLVANPKDEGQAVVRQFETSPVAWIGLAGLMRSINDTEGERQALAKAAEVGPDEPEVWFQQGLFCERQKDMKGATDAYRRLAELRPDDPTANNNTAYCLLVTGGDLKEALSRAEKAKEKLPTNSSVLHTLGVAQLRSGNLGESRKNLSTALELRPGDPTLLLDYGLLLKAENRPDDAKRHIELALRYADQLGLDFPRRAEAEKFVGSK